MTQKSHCQSCDTLPFQVRVGGKLFFFCFFFLFSKEKKKSNSLKKLKNPSVTYGDISLFKGDK